MLLEKIVAQKIKEVSARREAVPPADLEAGVGGLPPARDFAGALSRPPGPGLLAELKRASPSVGLIRADLDPAALARRYARAGARALSVLTDAPFFRGSLEDLAAARAASGLPVLRKDFVVDPYQVLEARAWGADAVLLIVRLLGARLPEYLALARDLGLAALVEVHSRLEVELALAAGAGVIGVNNRDLDTLEVDLGVGEELLPLLPSTVLRVAESGLATRDDVERMARAGADAVLIGQALVQPGDVDWAIKALGLGVD